MNSSRLKDDIIGANTGSIVKKLLIPSKLLQEISLHCTCQRVREAAKKVPPLMARPLRP